MNLKQGKATEQDYNPFVAGMGICYNQLMFNLSSVKQFIFHGISYFDQILI